MGALQLKDPSSVQTYSVDWTNELAGGETLSTSVWAVEPTGSLTVDSDSETTVKATVQVSGGTVGTVYRLSNTVTTSAGRTLERSLTVRVEQR